MRRSVASLGLADKIKGKLETLTKGNVVNPRASVSLLPEKFRHPSPASQPDYRFDPNFPVKDKVDTIAYYPRSGRRYVEPQTLVCSVSMKGITSVEAVKHAGTPDQPFTPVTLAKDSEKVLKVDVFAEFKKAIEGDDWTKPDYKIPDFEVAVHQYKEEPLSAWNEEATMSSGKD